MPGPVLRRFLLAWLAAVAPIGCGGSILTEDALAIAEGNADASGTEHAHGDACPGTVAAPPGVACTTTAGPLPEPLLHYAFDGDAENSGSLGSAYDGHPNALTWAPGKVGKAVGVGFPSWLALPGSAHVLEGQSRTIAMWIQPDVRILLGAPLFDCRGAEGFHTYHSAYHEPTLTTCQGDGAYGGGCGTITFAPCDWHHLLYRHEASPEGSSSLEIYVDGNLATTVTNADGTDAFGSGQMLDVYLGYSHDPSGWSAGTRHIVDELVVYDRVFSAEQQCIGILRGQWCGGRCVLP
jgi:hypothetical protein